ncbi:MAG: protein-L-isoaspartate(D-aspartate) O-methyltransferase [Candidatus Methylomirabilales bacterium]
MRGRAVWGWGLALILGLGAAQAAAPTAEEAQFARARAEMVERQLRGRDITDPAVLRAMAKVPRHRFVAGSLAARAYGDHPLPIGEGQTISQPYIVALMTQLLEPSGREGRVLEVGTGSGYQAAVLAELVREVYTIEILPGLAASAAERLRTLGYRNVQVRAGDGYQGWPEAAPFDGILVTAGASHIPAPLVEQLAEGARLVIPVDRGPGMQELIVGRKQGGVLVTRAVAPVRFVPLIEPKR